MAGWLDITPEKTESPAAVAAMLSPYFLIEMDQPQQLVDHFFRHESGRIVGLLTGEFGVRNIELAEDSVQQALIKALQTWGRKGIPDNPAAWLYRVARNQILDALRRVVRERNLDDSESRDRSQQIPASTHFQHQDVDQDIPDESLRLLFLCCHPSLSLESSIAVALKLVGGFSTEEISAALMTSKTNIEKRIYRATTSLREHGLELTDLHPATMRDRLESVHSTIYLMFNEGYASLSNAAMLRKDVCEEAIRLCKLLVGNKEVAQPSTSALLALLLLHLARFDARLGNDGNIVLMEEQDRNLWNYSMIREALDWMIVSTADTRATRYHIEASIAWEHCRAQSFEEVDWHQIVRMYEMLLQIHPSPMVRLSLAIACMYACGNEEGLKRIVAIDGKDRQNLRPWWDGALAMVHQRLHHFSAAAAHYQDALTLTSNPNLKQFFAAKLELAKHQLRAHTEREEPGAEK